MSCSWKPKPSRDRSHANADRLALEVVAEREVAEHLEEREMPRGRADDLDVGGAERLLAGRHARVRRALLAEEVRLQRVHPGDREQRRGVVLGRDQRRGGQPQVVALLEELVKVRRISSEVIGTECRHQPVVPTVRPKRVQERAIVPQPTTSSPSIRHASWPGAAPSTRLGELDRSAPSGDPAADPRQAAPRTAFER